jgi:hypothetical protein
MDIMRGACAICGVDQFLATDSAPCTTDIDGTVSALRIARRRA